MRDIAMMPCSLRLGNFIFPYSLRCVVIGILFSIFWRSRCQLRLGDSTPPIVGLDFAWWGLLFFFLFFFSFSFFPFFFFYVFFFILQ